MFLKNGLAENTMFKTKQQKQPLLKSILDYSTAFQLWRLMMCQFTVAVEQDVDMVN